MEIFFKDCAYLGVGRVQSSDCIYATAFGQSITYISQVHVITYILLHLSLHTYMGTHLLSAMNGWHNSRQFGFIKFSRLCRFHSKTKQKARSVSLSLSLSYPLYLIIMKSITIQGGSSVKKRLGLVFFIKNGPTQASFSFMFVFSNTHYNFYRK